MKSALSVAANLNEAQVALQNAKSNPEVLALLGACGYDANKIKEGLARHKAAQDKFNALQSTLGDQLSASAAYRTARKEARRSFQRLAKACRALWTGESGKLTRIGLNKRMPNQDGAFLTEARALFEQGNHTAAMLEELEEHGFGEESIASEAEKIEALDAANQAHELTKGATRQASVEFRAAFQALKTWTARFRKFARLALHEKPQLLEKLGIAVRSVKTKAQRGAPAKAAATRQETATKQKLLRLVA